MPAQTTYMGLNKPNASETVNIADLNYNMDKLDIHRHTGAAGDGLPAMPVGASNLLVNGGFEAWPLGPGTFTGNGIFTANRWQSSNKGTGLYTIDVDTTQLDDCGTAAMKVTFTYGDRAWYVFQAVENYYDYRGKTVSFRVRVKSPVTNGNIVMARIYDGITTSSSAYHTGGDAYKSLDCTHTVAMHATCLWVEVYFNNSCLSPVYLDNAMLVAGSQPTDYYPLSPAEEQGRCQRYFEQHGATNSVPRIDTYNGAANEAPTVTVMFNTQKAATPTLTKYGTWDVSGFRSIDPVVGGASPTGYYVIAVSTAAGAHFAYPGSADDIITAVANP